MRTKNLGAIIEDSIRADSFKTIFSRMEKRGLLLDLGCGGRPYLSIYEPYFEKTLGADLQDSPFDKFRVDIFCSATEVPLPDQSVDVVFSSEVLHDIAKPEMIMKEVYRLLKPGGKFIFSSPFMVPICDGEYDHYRYTKYGLKFLLEEQKFTNIKIVETGNLFGASIQLGIKPQLRFWSKLSKIFRIKFIYSLWNPFVFLFVFLPQAMYVGLYNLSKRFKPLDKMGRKYSYSAIGYVSYAEKPL